MIVGLLRSNNATAFIALPLVALAIWSFAFFIPNTPDIKHAMPLYELVLRPMVNISWLNKIIAVLLIIAEGFLLNYIVNENDVLTKKTNLPALFYIVFISNNSAMFELHPVLFSNLFLLFALNKILNSYRKDVAFSQVFDAGLLISIATLFYFPCIVFLPLIGIALIIFRPFLWREWIISFIGVLIPYVFVITYYFWNNMLGYLVFDKMLLPAVTKADPEEYPGSFYFLLSVGCMIVVLSLGGLLKGLEGGSQKTKKALILMIWYFAFAGLSVFFAPRISTKYFSLLTIPLAVICSNYYLRMKKELLGELLFLVFLIALFINLIVNIF
jgi:hypothetical protein